MVAVPSYGGRIPSVVTDMFRKVKADGCVLLLLLELLVLLLGWAITATRSTQEVTLYKHKLLHVISYVD